MTSVTCLIGNGASIAYNPELSVPALTKGIVEAFRNRGGTNAGNALANFAAQATGTDTKEDFERLLGPLDHITNALPMLNALTPALAASPPNVQDSFDRVTEVLHDLHRLGLASVLDLVARRAQGQGQDTLDATVGALCNRLMGLPWNGLLTMATISYDGLLHAAMLEQHMADLAAGFNEAERVIVQNGDPIPSWPLRTSADFPLGPRIHVVQLHGSLGWLRDAEGSVRKFRIEDLRQQNYWAHLGEGSATATPVVVLTDRKEQQVGTPPFELAYRVLQERLIASDKWLVAGYGFNDTPVNNALRRSIKLRHDMAQGDPDILVLGRGNEGPIRQAVSGVLTVPRERLFVDGAGVPASVGGGPWSQWAPEQ